MDTVYTLGYAIIKERSVESPGPPVLITISCEKIHNNDKSLYSDSELNNPGWNVQNTSYVPLYIKTGQIVHIQRLFKSKNKSNVDGLPQFFKMLLYYDTSKNEKDEEITDVLIHNIQFKLGKWFMIREKHTSNNMFPFHSL